MLIDAMLVGKLNEQVKNLWCKLQVFLAKIVFKCTDYRAQQ